MKRLLIPFLIVCHASIANPQWTVAMVTPSLIVKSFHHFLFISPIRGTTPNNLSL